MKPKLLSSVPKRLPRGRCILWEMDTTALLSALPEKPLWDLVVTSPPYNIGKIYEAKRSLDDYRAWQTDIIRGLVSRLADDGSICWQVGNFIENGHIEPLDYVFHPIFAGLGLKLRNRIVWRYGHGMHQRRRFSGRYEVVLWYTKSDDYVFDLDAVRVPPKYPGKRAYKGPRAGKLSSHPLGKNPEDVWEVPEAQTDFWNIPNVKAAHLEKTGHPCQFPVGLVERLVLALSQPNARVFDPFSGVGSAGVAAALHWRKFWGCEIDPEYTRVAAERITDVVNGAYRFRSHARPLYDHTMSPLSRVDGVPVGNERPVQMNGKDKRGGGGRRGKYLPPNPRHAMKRGGGMELGWPFPKRQEFLRKLVSDKSRYQHQLRFQRTLRTFGVHKVPIGLPRYRLENGRTYDRQAEYLAEHPEKPNNFFEVDLESAEAQEVQHQILVKLERVHIKPGHIRLL